MSRLSPLNGWRWFCHGDVQLGQFGPLTRSRSARNACLIWEDPSWEPGVSFSMKMVNWWSNPYISSLIWRVHFLNKWFNHFQRPTRFLIRWIHWFSVGQLPVIGLVLEKIHRNTCFSRVKKKVVSTAQLGLQFWNFFHAQIPIVDGAIPTTPHCFWWSFPFSMVIAIFLLVISVISMIHPDFS